MILEKEKDRKNEKAAQEWVLFSTGWKLRKLPKRYTVDWARVDNDEKVNGWVEYKHRSHTKDQYKTYMISCGKLVDGMKLSALTQRPFFLIVSFKVGSINPETGEELREFHVCEITKNVLKGGIVMGGRSDRGYDFDMEPVYHIPYSLFSSLKPEYYATSY